MHRSSVALVLVAILGLTGCSRPTGAEASASAPAASSNAVEPPRSDSKMRGWQRGQEYSYRFQSTSRIALGDKTPLYDFDLSARAQLVAFEVSGNEASFFLSLEGAKFVSRISGSQPELDRLSAQLKEPYFFDMKGGLVSTVNVPKELHPLATAVFRSISASLQFALIDGAPRAFTIREFDTTGQYEAKYTPTSDPHLWHKEKQKYLGILLGDNESKEAREVAPKIVQSKAEIRLSPEGRPVQINMRDELELANAQMPLHSNTVVSLVADAARPARLEAAELRAQRDKTVALAANAPYQSASDRKSLDDAKIDGMTFDKVLGNFEQIAGRPKIGTTNQSLDAKRAEFKKQADEEAKLFVALGALFRAQPGTIQQAVSKIKGKSVASDALVDALGSAGTAEAQDVLIALVKDPGSGKMLKGRALLSLSRSENPTNASVKTLLGLINNEQLGSQALYGLGNYVRAFTTDGQREAADALGHVLLRRLTTAKSEMKIIEALRALANSGFSPAFESVKPYLKDPREQVRVDAVLALALMSAPEVDAQLVERLSLDSAKKVRLAALEAMGGRAPNDLLANGLRENVTADDPHVRYRAVEIMIRWLPKRRELREDVQSVARNDSEQQIRELAKAAL